MKEKYLFASESVTEGHPDKMCDIISDAILDEYLKNDENARVACEVTATGGIINVMGEISSNSKVDIISVVRETISDIGYTKGEFDFDAENYPIIVSLNKQSGDIDIGVSCSLEVRSRKNKCANCDDSIVCGDTDDDPDNLLGAGDQGMMFGYACNETDNLMPAPIFYAHELCKKLSYVRKNNILDYLGPDGKSMITFEYNDGRPVRIDAIVVSAQHLNYVYHVQIEKDIKREIIDSVIPSHFIDENTKILVNPTGRFVKGGPSADSGLTGRKIIVDTYGGAGRHGGGSFSGKDPTKVDRTGAYAARYITKNIVAAGIAERCEVQVSYAIGLANPVSIYVDTFGTSSFSNGEITDMVINLFDLRLASLIKQFDLRKPIYKRLAAYGHMGREDLGVAWEKTDKIKEIKEYLNVK